MRNLILAPILFIIVFTSYKNDNIANESPQEKDHSENVDSLDMEKIIIIKYSSENDWAFKYNKPFIENNINPVDSISKIEILKCETILRELINEYNNSKAITEFENYKKIWGGDAEIDEFKIEIEFYYRQYIFIEHDNETYAYIIGINNRSMIDSYYTRLANADGGGNHFFHLIVNLNRLQHYGFRVNSPI